jgi:hypothetical protein
MPQNSDPASEQLETGGSMATKMSSHGFRGLKGKIVAQATAGGIPVNFNPHDRSGISVTIEPESGNKQILALSEITGERVDAALAKATAVFPGGDIESTRERTAMAFEELAKSAAASVQRVPIKKQAAVRRVTSLPIAPQPDEEEHEMVQELTSLAEDLAAANRPQIDRNCSPMAAFGGKRHAASPPSPSSIPSARVTEPQNLAYFEKEGLGTVPAFFHDILVSVTRDDPALYEYSGFMVLVYDLRYAQNAARWFPPSDDPYQRPWAVAITGDPRVYLVHTTGFQYVYDNREHCVLRVERALMSEQEAV